MPLPNIPASLKPTSPEQLLNAAQGLVATVVSDLQSVGAAGNNAANQITQAATSLQTAVASVTTISTSINTVIDHIKEIGDDLKTFIAGIVPPTGVPTILVIGKLDNREYTDPVLWRNDIIRKIDEGQKSITIQWWGPDTVAFRSLLSKQGDDLKQHVRTVLLPLPIRVLLPVNFWDGMTPEIFWYLVGVACIILAVGVTFLGICMGLAILYALYKGYRVSAENCAELFGGQVFSLCQTIHLTNA